MYFLINSLFTNISQFSWSESKIGRVSGGITSVRKIWIIASGIRNGLDHIIVGNKSMHLWVKIYFSDISLFFRSHKANTYKARWLRARVRSIVIVRGIAPSMRDR